MFRITLCSASLLLAGSLAFAQTDTPPTREAIAAAAEAGEPGAAFDYGYELTFPSSGEPDYATGRYWLDRSANAGNPAASHILGLVYRDGIGVDADMDQARRFFSQGWEAGSSASGFALAELMIFDGEGEVDAAIAILEQLADDDQVGPIAQLTLADALFFFQESRDSDARAIGLASAALARNPELVEANYLIGIGAMEGLGREADPAAAMSFWRRGALGGDPYSMIALADATRDGASGQPDPVEALSLYQAAARLGDPQAADEAEALSRELSIQQRAAAEARVSDWLSAPQ